MQKTKLTLLLVLVTTLLALRAPAEVRLPAIFSNRMVLQRDRPIVLWGWAKPNETITVQLFTSSQEVKANERGEWKATLPPMKACGPLILTVTGATSNELQFDDVMIGDVWLCSGQSNMEMGIGLVNDAKAEIAAGENTGIRLFMVPNRWLPQAQTNIQIKAESEVGTNGHHAAEGLWKLCTPTNLAESGWSGFSATAYFFARELSKQLEPVDKQKVTIGVIDSTWGGTRIESWTPPEGFANSPALQQQFEQVQLGDPSSAPHQQRLQQVIGETEKWVEAAREALTNKTLVPTMPTYPADLLPPHDLQQATALYNGMIHPLHPYGLRGAIWYQGESNLGDGLLYYERMKALISGWREVWGQPDLPFYFVQIAPFNYGTKPEIIGDLWEAQVKAAQNIPHTGMAVINDIGDVKDIHPKNKQEVGRRLALLALAGTYGRTNLACSGPVFKAMTIEDNKIRLSFDHAEGLASRDGKPLSWFEIIDADEGGFVKADAQIDGSTIVLSAAEVKHPVAMHFAWSMFAEPNLMNAAGLPASAFRAGEVPKRDALLVNVPEAKGYKLALDLDLTKLGPVITYDADNRAKLQEPFDRVAYFVELQGADSNAQYVYVSTDAFTDSLDKIGVPTVQSAAHFQQNVAHMNVFSNVKGIVNGTNLAGGNMEFWPNNYVQANKAKVPHASNTVYDFGDEPTDVKDGHGSMQIHNHDAKQTLFALNNWKAGKAADLGIGNQAQGNPDWTFAKNAASYPVARLRVLVRSK